MTKSKLRRSRNESLAKANAKNSKKNKSMDKTNTDINLNTAMIESQLETSDNSDITPDLWEEPFENEFDSDVTEAESESSSDHEFLPSTDKSMMISYKFLVNLMKLVSCPSCQKQGGLVPNVTYLCGFLVEINFLCRCKYSFCLANFSDSNINAVLIRNLVSNGIPKQAFQRWLQIGNFGADIDGEAQSTNLFTRSIAKTYKEQNDVIIEGAEAIHRTEMDHLVRANLPVVMSTDMCYAKRGYHSPAGHAALICDGKVIDARTVKRSQKPSENAFGEIVDLPANKIEQHAVEIMVKDAIQVIGPLIKQIDVDQDATIQKVLKDMKWEAEDVGRVNKFTGQQHITEDMVGQSVWPGEIPDINFDKVKTQKIGMPVWVPIVYFDWWNPNGHLRNWFLVKKIMPVWVPIVYFDW